MERWPGTDLPWHRALTAGNPGQQCWEINRRGGIPRELQSGEARLGYQRAEILWKCCLCPWEQGRADGITSEPCPGAQHGAGWAGGTGRVSETALKGPGRGEGMGNTQSSAGLAGNGQGLGQMCCVLCQMCSVLCPVLCLLPDVLSAVPTATSALCCFLCSALSQPCPSGDFCHHLWAPVLAHPAQSSTRQDYAPSVQP